MEKDFRSLLIKTLSEIITSSKKNDKLEKAEIKLKHMEERCNTKITSIIHDKNKIKVRMG